MTKKRELRFQESRELRVQTSPDGSRTISGYAIRYNEPSVGMAFTEIVAPGAVTDSLKQNPSVLCLRDHNPSLLMGRTTSKTLTLTEDASGLRFVCKLPNTTQANDLAESIERSDLDGVSFGFSVPSGGDKWSTDSKGNVTRTLHKIDLAEISPCSFPAYPTTSVSVRTCPKELRGLLRSQSDDADDDDEICDCDCPECQAGDCEDCTNPDFDHDEDRSDRLTATQRSMMQARVEIARRK